MTKPSRSGYRYRSFLQFRLRTLLVFLLLASFAMALWHRYLDSYREQQQAVAAIAKHAKHISFKPGQPAWMRHFSEERVFKDVVHLSFQSHREFTDEDMAHLAKMPRLARLSLQHTSVTDEGLRHLSKLTELNTLSLESTAVTDDGLKQLGGLRKLRRLQLNYTKVSGKGLAHLQELQGLQRLEISNAVLEEGDLGSLLQLAGLKELELEGSQLSGDGWAGLSALRELETLELRSRKIGELRLQGLKNLRTLTAPGSVQRLHLHDLPQLSQLYISGGLPDATNFQDLPRLQKLVLSRRRIHDGAFVSLGSLSGLRTLDLS